MGQNDNLWTVVELRGPNRDGEPVNYTIADATACSQGQLLQLNDGRVAALSTATTTVYAGIAAEDHIANKGVTKVVVWTDGIFEALCSLGVTLGASITGAEDNEVNNLTTFASKALITTHGAGCLGYAYEDGTAITETIEVRLKL